MAHDIGLFQTKLSRDECDKLLTVPVWRALLESTCLSMHRHFRLTKQFQLVDSNKINDRPVYCVQPNRHENTPLYSRPPGCPGNQSVTVTHDA
ncbi:MAG: hypothetical protein Q8M09_05140 [Pseudomonadota bacterium]|nr:hypothetical protein [Pseudomonadota bacterium]MDP1903620.1 hypothetical protein [Pseudomonadota bacterium]MDP2353912.1 hypothetical protein [Pseudomonadota bacterium]